MATWLRGHVAKFMAKVMAVATLLATAMAAEPTSPSQFRWPSFGEAMGSITELTNLDQLQAIAIALAVTLVFAMTWAMPGQPGHAIASPAIPGYSLAISLA